jgi:hypothetical protein
MSQQLDPAQEQADGQLWSKPFASGQIGLGSQEPKSYDHYSNHNIDMSYTRKYDTRIPEINERIHEFLNTKHLTGQVEYEFQPGDVNMPTGWATLAVDSADPKLHHELNCVISNLENITQKEWMPETEPNLSDHSYQTQ